MPIRKAPKQNNQKSIIYLTFFILLSIPIMLYGLAQENFDIRNRAFDDLVLSEEHQCLISLPNVNPYSLEVGKTVTIQVDAKLDDDSIVELKIADSEDLIIYSEEFENSPIDIATSFDFTPEYSGTVDMIGTLTTGQGRTIECEISSPYDVKGLRAIENNSSPEFSSSPSSSIPSQDIKTATPYEYTLTATDEDGDTINYSYSFTPRADWLKPVIVEDGSNGKLTIKFRGSTTEPASYLANVFIHDGYSTHLRAQSWVISVSPEENDIPVVRITDPVTSKRLDKGESLRTSWEATDLNHIAKYDLFVSNNPAKQDTWEEIKADISNDTESYNIDSSTLNAGTYQIIVKATDNQTPPAVGIGISPEIVISETGKPTEGKDDLVVLHDPQVINMSPLNTEEVTNRRVTIKASIVAGKGSEIDSETIVFRVDEKDVTESIKINKISEEEYTLIYQPEQDLDTGVHKVDISFADTNETEVSKSWNFTISADETSDETYNIFGYEIRKNIVLIVGIGIITVILALVAPIVIFSIWKDDKKDKPQSNDRIPPSVPKDETPYTEPVVENPVFEKIQPQVEPPQQEDSWDKYSAPEPVQIDSAPIAEPVQQEPIQIEEPPVPEPEIPTDIQNLAQQIAEIKQNDSEVVNE